MSRNEATHVVRAIGRWSLAALVINSVIGSGIFGLPSSVAALTGRQSPMVFILAAVGIGVIMACFAEVASRFRESGGPYLYTKMAFGRFVGLQTAWLNFLTRAASSAANVNLFVVYLAEFLPWANDPFLRLLIMTTLIAILTAINVRGVRIGTGVSNLFTVSKLGPLLVFIAVGCGFLFWKGSPVPKLPEYHTTGTWLNAILLVIFAYGGFEGALVPVGEAKNPEQDAPFALLAALAVCVPAYALVQFVVVKTLMNPAQGDRPLAAAAHVIGGPPLAGMISAAVLISIVGYLAAGMIANPRILFALAEHKDFPSKLATVHNSFHTPYISILFYAFFTWTFALSGTFTWNAKLSAVTRLITYALTCGALPMLRFKDRSQPQTLKAAGWRLPLGNVFAAFGIIFSVLIFSRAGRAELAVLAVVLAVAALNWVAVRGRGVAEIQKSN